MKESKKMHRKRKANEGISQTDGGKEGKYHTKINIKHGQ